MTKCGSLFQRRAGGAMASVSGGNSNVLSTRADHTSGPAGGEVIFARAGQPSDEVTPGTAQRTWITAPSHPKRHSAKMICEKETDSGFMADLDSVVSV